MIGVKTPKPTDEAWGTCDWGGCDLPSYDWRWAPDLREWLPVCYRHRQQ